MVRLAEGDLLAGLTPDHYAQALYRKPPQDNLSKGGVVCEVERTWRRANQVVEARRVLLA